MNVTGPQWFKCSHGSEDSDACVEIAITPHAVPVRDSKNRDGGRLAFSPAARADFVAYAKR